MIQLTQEEIWAFNILTQSVQNVQDELGRCVQGRAAFIKLLEEKYNATFSPDNGNFVAKEAEES